MADPGLMLSFQWRSYFSLEGLTAGSFSSGWQTRSKTDVFGLRIEQ